MKMLFIMLLITSCAKKDHPSTKNKRWNKSWATDWDGDGYENQADPRPYIADVPKLGFKLLVWDGKNPHKITFKPSQQLIDTINLQLAKNIKGDQFTIKTDNLLESSSLPAFKKEFVNFEIKDLNRAGAHLSFHHQNLNLFDFHLQQQERKMNLISSALVSGRKLQFLTRNYQTDRGDFALMNRHIQERTYKIILLSKTKTQTYHIAREVSLREAFSMIDPTLEKRFRENRQITNETDLEILKPDRKLLYLLNSPSQDFSYRPMAEEEIILYQVTLKELMAIHPRKQTEIFPVADGQLDIFLDDIMAFSLEPRITTTIAQQKTGTMYCRLKLPLGGRADMYFKIWEVETKQVRDFHRTHEIFLNGAKTTFSKLKKYAEFYPQSRAELSVRSKLKPSFKLNLGYELVSKKGVQHTRKCDRNFLKTLGKKRSLSYEIKFEGDIKVTTKPRLH